MGERPTEMTPPVPGEPVEASPVSSSEEPEQIRAEIAQTRAEMADTIDALQEKLNPERLMTEAKDRVREATVGKVKDMMSSATDTAGDLASQVQNSTEEAVRYVRQNPWPAAAVSAGLVWLLMRNRGDQPRSPSRPSGLATRDYDRSDAWMSVVRDNPVPAALAGIGLGWMVRNYNRTHQVPRGYQDTRVYRTTRAGQLPTSPGSTSGTSTTWSEPAESVASSTQSAVSDAARQARERMDDVANRVQEGWQRYSTRAESEFDRWMRENPLTVGAAAIAIGAAVGLSAPRTETEDAWLGETRDSLMEQAQDAARSAAQSTVERAQDLVGDSEGSPAQTSQGGQGTATGQTATHG